ncbi:MAG: hypothetical protein FWH48_04190, partial [Oscillospiraceae bacterium]|nr:hypothetical protein [Oscillospiraceae bacterium]
MKKYFESFENGKNAKNSENAKNKKRARTRAIMRVSLACFGLLCAALIFVFYSQSALTMETEPGMEAVAKTESVLVCGLEEHLHGEGCYARELICGLEETEEADEAQEPAEDRQAATPSDLLPAEETSGHLHTEDCY